MENYQMSRPGCRPYNRTCGMNNPRMRDTSRQPERNCENRHNSEKECDCQMPGTKSRDPEMYSHLEHLEPAMAYVPCQKYDETFDIAYALRVGTIFPQLCKPFCGKRGGR